MTVPTKVPDARFKRADELEPGDWVTLVGDFGPAKILSTYTYDGDMGERRTLVSLLDSDRQVPETTRVFANNRIELLTQAQIDEQRAFIARQQVAAQLRQLADLIVQHRLPLPRMSVSVSLNVETVDQVRHVARALGLEIGPWNRGEGATTSWPRDHKTYEAGVHADWHCYSGSLEQPEPVGSPAQADIDAAKFSTDPMTRAAAEAYEDDEGDEDPTGLTYSREDDDPQVIRPHSPRVPLHVGVRESDGGELVDETPAEAQPPAATVPANAVTVHFSFGPDHTDPTTGESLHRKYVTIVGPSHEACREAMFASRYGRGWGTDYLAGTDQADEWIPHWTEHERIVLDAANADEPVHYLDRGSDGESADRVACGVNVDELDGYTTRPGVGYLPGLRRRDGIGQRVPLMARNTLPLEPPLPVVPPVGRCRFPELLVEVVPLKLWQHQVILPCFERATRRVKVGLHVDEPVCLWHSLVVQQRLGGHLVRDYART